MRLVYLSPVPWHSFTQRPHQFVDWFHARTTSKVLWVEPYPTRLPMLADLYGKRPKYMAATKEIPAWLSLLSPRTLPIEPLLSSYKLNRWLWGDMLRAIKAFVEEGDCLLVIGKPSELALQVLRQHADIPSIYDAMDDFPAFYQGLSRMALVRREQQIVTAVSRLLVSSTALSVRFANYHTKLALALNACDSGKLPFVNTPFKNFAKPLLGYIGTIGHWFDWPLVFALANANPSISIRLIGPVYVAPPKPLPSNIELLPACEHAMAIKFMQEFSVGLIPFKCTDLTASVDPIKYYEYRALGLPVLCTRFGEMALRDGDKGVFFMDRQTDFACQVKTVLAYESDLSEIDIFREKNSWEARFDNIDIFL